MIIKLMSVCNYLLHKLNKARLSGKARLNVKVERTSSDKAVKLVARLHGKVKQTRSD